MSRFFFLLFLEIVKSVASASRQSGSDMVGVLRSKTRKQGRRGRRAPRSGGGLTPAQGWGCLDLRMRASEERAAREGGKVRHFLAWFPP